MDITIGEVKGYLKVEEEEDTIFRTLIDAAISHCETILNRPLAEANMTDDNRWTPPESIKIAVYLLCSHWYENRLPVGQITEEIAFSVSAILNPHRFRNI